MIYNFYKEVQNFFPEFDYNAPVGDRSVLCNFNNPKNAVGHQQRAFSIFWALKQCGPLDLGLDLGSHRGLTPYCMHIDLYYGNGKPHPFYDTARSYWTEETCADIVCDASQLTPFPNNVFPLVTSNHSLEHMPGDDEAIINMLCDQWLRVLRTGGILAMVIPDNDCFDVLASDKDHKNAWGHTDFQWRILDKVLSRGQATLIEYNTLLNNFSFNVVLRKK